MLNINDFSHENRNDMVKRIVEKRILTEENNLADGGKEGESLDESLRTLSYNHHLNKAEKYAYLQDKFRDNENKKEKFSNKEFSHREKLYLPYQNCKINDEYLYDDISFTKITPVKFKQWFNNNWGKEYFEEDYSKFAEYFVIGEFNGGDDVALTKTKNGLPEIHIWFEGDPEEAIRKIHYKTKEYSAKEMEKIENSNSKVSEKFNNLRIKNKLTTPDIMKSNLQKMKANPKEYFGKRNIPESQWEQRIKDYEELVNNLSKKSLKEAEDVESVNDKTTVLNNLRSDIQDEYTAIKGYDAHADFAEKNGCSDIAEILRDIRDEEKVHVGELEAVMKKYDKEFKDSLADGGNEAEEVLEETKKWKLSNFNTVDSLGEELARLHAEKEKHLKLDDMPSMYYENIDKHIEELNDKMKNFKCKCTELNGAKQELNKENLLESRLPSDPNIDPQFGVPSQKKYPLFDEKHVRSAIKLFGHVDGEYEQQLARAILVKMKKYNIPYDTVGPDNKLYKWIPAKYKENK